MSLKFHLKTTTTCMKQIHRLAQFKEDILLIIDTLAQIKYELEIEHQEWVTSIEYFWTDGS